ncbi:MAG: DEAD/DEAH box helicase [Chromatiaceae bacterium]|nr:DEAD/DEAH box helicase [Chromatiaceae bacterium]
MFKPHPFQEQIITDLRLGYGAGHLNQVLALGTGGGKTIIAALLGQRAATKGKTLLFIVHTIELAGQAVDAFVATGLRVGILRGDETNYSSNDDVVVASIQTIRSRSAPDWVDICIIDEVHILHAEHIRLISDWAEKAFIGLSATPMRKGLGQHFTNLVRGPTIAELTEGGFLVPVRAFAPQADSILAALEGVACGTTTAGFDYKEQALGTAMNRKELVGDIVKTWQERGEDRPTLCFAVNIAHSKSIRDDFLAAGVQAAHLDAYTDASERRDIIAGFKAGDIKLLTSVNVLGIGFNVPDAACLILARPTLSLALHIQQCGRGLRTAEGKSDCIVLDHSGNCLKHGLPHHFEVPDLDMGDKEDPAKRKKKERPPFVACTECGGIMSREEITCPHCGLDRPGRMNRVSYLDGVLVEYGEDEKDQEAGRQESPIAFYQAALGWLLARDKNPNAAYYLTQDRHPGCKPPYSWRDLPPIEPSPEQQRWIANRRRYQGIRRAHSPAWRSA